MAPLFNWLSKRSFGILLHPSALPSQQGIGNFGESARRFVDFLGNVRANFWQLCPLGPTGFSDSPYQCFSSFAGNPYFIDLSELSKLGLASEEDLAPLKNLSWERVEFVALSPLFQAVLAKIFENYKAVPEKISPLGDFKKFKKENADWLRGYSLFSALKKHFSGKPWYEWPEKARKFSSAKKQNWGEKIENDAELSAFFQFVFFAQWENLRIYARSRGVEIIGDIPIFTALDSADVWENPEIFQIDKAAGTPNFVAGVPPDYFSSTGQLWGNPLYDWTKLKKTNFAWWISRLRAAFKIYDVVRIDHFRAFHDYWQIPASAADARSGKWQKGPGIKFFEEVKKSFGNAKLIAEDLGDLNDGVRQLLAETGLPGMAVLMFAFGGDPKNLYLPQNIRGNTIVYPGTHDNDTICGWYEAAGTAEKDFFRRYLWTDGRSPNLAMINAAMKSHAKIAIVSAQDILGLGSDARFNVPGTNCDKNWSWRLSEENFSALENLTGTLRELVEISARA